MKIETHRAETDDALVCSICNKDAERRQDFDSRVNTIQCNICGEYTISYQLLQDLPREIGELSPYLSAATRQASESGQVMMLKSETWRDHAEAHRHVSFHSKTQKLLRLIKTRSTHAGSRVEVTTATDYPMIDTVNREEMLFMIDHAKAFGYIVAESPASGGGITCILTIRGWETLDPSSSGTAMLGRVFVAMSFDESLYETYSTGIKPAVEVDCQLEAVRVDEVITTNKICDQILAEIRRCQFVVADYTQHKGAVYFEDGFATGLVLSCTSSA